MNGKWTGLLAALTFGVGVAGYAASASPDEMAWAFAPLSEGPSFAAAPGAAASIIDSATPDLALVFETPPLAATAVVAPSATPTDAPEPFDGGVVFAAGTGGSPAPLDTLTPTPTALPASPTATPDGPVYHAPDYPPPSYIPGAGSDAAGPSGATGTPVATQTPPPDPTANNHGQGGKPNGAASDRATPAAATHTPDGIAIFITPTPAH